MSVFRKGVKSPKPNKSKSSKPNSAPHGKILKIFKKAFNRSPNFVPKNSEILKDELKKYKEESNTSGLGKFTSHMFGKFDPVEERNAFFVFLKFIVSPIPRSVKSVVCVLSAAAVGYSLRSIQKSSNFFKISFANFSNYVHSVGFENVSAVSVSSIAIGYWAIKMVGYVRRRYILKSLLNKKKKSLTKSISELDRATKISKDNEHIEIDVNEKSKLQDQLDVVNKELDEYKKDRMFEAVKYGAGKLAWAGGFASLSTVLLQSAQPLFLDGVSGYALASFLQHATSLHSAMNVLTVGGIPLIINISMNFYAEYKRTKKSNYVDEFGI